MDKLSTYENVITKQRQIIQRLTSQALQTRPSAIGYTKRDDMMRTKQLDNEASKNLIRSRWEEELALCATIGQEVIRKRPVFRMKQRDTVYRMKKKRD